MTSLGRALSAALVHFVWQGALVALLFSLILVALRKRSPQGRCLAGCLALATLAILPFVTAYTLYRPLALTGNQSTLKLTTDWMLPAWAAGVLRFSCRPVWNLVHVHTLRRKGIEPEAWIRELASSIAKRMGATQAFWILISAVSETPALIGWIRPVILLPAATVAGLTVDQLETVLAHEIAHIRRNDYLINALQVAIETLLFYHPAVWWISSRIRRERELCCDDEVVRLTGDALCYARTLTTLERLRTTAPALAVGSAGGQLSYRIRRLVGDAQPSREILPAFLALALTLSCVTIGVKRAHGQQAQDTVTVEVTRDNQGAVSAVRVVSGPAYLRPLALQAAVQIPPRAMPTTPINALRPELGGVQTIAFPAAFSALGDLERQQAVVEMFVGDELALAERNVRDISGQSPVNQQALAAAREQLAEMRYKQSIVQLNEALVRRPEKTWKVQVLSHELTDFRERYKGKLNNTNPELAAHYSRIEQSLAAAQRDLADVGTR